MFFTVFFFFFGCEDKKYRKFKEFELEIQIGDKFEEIGSVINKSDLSYSISQIKDEKVIIEVDGPQLSSEVIELIFDCNGVLINKSSYH